MSASNTLVRAGSGFLWRLSARRDPVRAARHLGVEVGEACRIIGLNRLTFGSEPFLISLGNHVEVTSGVRFVTHDGGVWVLREQSPDIDVFGAIRVGNNVFVGMDALILPGVTIGNNVVIGARSVVTKDVDDNEVVAGVPAKVVSSYSDYATRCRAAGVPTKRMSPERKRTFLQRMFNSHV